jgi:hypothetical protein
VADRFLDDAEQDRITDPSGTIPIIAIALLTDGRLLAAEPSRDDRKAILKLWADTLPVFGYVLLADVYVHRVNVDRADGKTVTGTETTDALICHIGSRTGLRQMRTRPYRLVNGAAVFDPADRQDMDKRHEQVRDPYADLFAFPVHTER